MSTDKSPHRDSKRALFRFTSIVSLGTLSSRILGFVREIIFALFLGTTARADAFFVAFRIPNLFRSLVGEGAVNSAIVPVLSEYDAKVRKEEFWQFASVIFCLSLIVLSIITIAGIFATPWIIRMMAPGFVIDSEKLALTIVLTRIMFPYLILIGITSYAMGILYTFRLFWTPAFSPCLLNISIIISALVASQKMEEPVFGLAIGVLVGGALQLMAHVRALRRAGMRFQKPKTLLHPSAIKVGKLLAPRLVGAGVYQLNIFVDTLCASLSMIVGFGGISAIYYANRIIQFPLGVFGLAMVSVALPTMSGQAIDNDLGRLKETLFFSIKNIFFIMIPVTVLLILLGHPVIRILLQRGAFDSYSTMITSSALMFYAVGLFSYGCIKILVAGFHAMQDTVTPVKIAGVSLVVNFLLNFILMFPLGIGGIALASSIAATVNFIMLYYAMEKRLNGFPPGLLLYFLKIFTAACVMGGIVFQVWNQWGGIHEIFKLIAVGALAGTAYLLVCFIFKVDQTESLTKWMSKSK